MVIYIHGSDAEEIQNHPSVKYVEKSKVCH